MKPLSTEDKATLYEEAEIKRVHKYCEEKKAEADFELKCLKILIPLGFRHASWNAYDQCVKVSVDVFDHGRISDAELVAAQKVLRKFPYSYQYAGVIVRKKAVP